jgi:hypothetical protein
MLCHRGGASLSSLEKFVLDRCRSSLHLALKFFWYVQSYVEDEGGHVSSTGSFVRQLRSSCEMSLVNGSQESGGDDALDKVARSEYFTRVTQFVDRLMRISNTLRSVPPADRAKQLQLRLQDLVSQPVYVPLWPADSPHFTVVRLPVEEGLVLASRDRVPYMIFLEVLQSKVVCSSEPNAHKHAADILHLMDRLRRDVVAVPDGGDQPSAAEQKALEQWMEQRASEVASSLAVSAAPQSSSAVASRASESWSERRTRLARESPFSADPHWSVCSFVVKFGDDCRQELLAVQLLGAIKRVFERASLPLWISPHHQVCSLFLCCCCYFVVQFVQGSCCWQTFCDCGNDPRR